MLAELFTLIIYQPFFNVLIFFYWILGQFTDGKPDMGIAVIMLTILIRLLLLPISLMEERSEEERRAIAAKVKEIDQEVGHDPIQHRLQLRGLFKSKPRVIAGELFSLFIQVTISLMLWQIFGKGLGGRDLHLVYPFMPAVEYPFNLQFLGVFDLQKKSFILNIVQSLLIFVLETLSAYSSPYPTSRNEVIKMQFFLPVVSFFIFLALPAGKKLFVITALIFSILVTLYKAIKYRFERYQLEQEEKAAAAAAATTEPSEQVLVEVK